MNKIPPAALTNEIAKSAAAQMTEYNYTEKMKKCGNRPDITAFVPQKIVEKTVQDISTKTVFIGVDFSSSPDMTGYIDIKRLMQNENN